MGIKDILNHFIKTMLISCIVFSVLKTNLNQYLGFIYLTWGYICLNFKTKKSNEVFCLFTIVTISNFVSYVLLNINNKTFLDSLIESTWAVILIIIMLGMFIYNYSLYKKKINVEQEEALIPKREKDLNRIIKYINSSNIIGVNAEWGTGKSFIVNKLCKKISSKYEIISIDILACNIDEILLILINEIEKVMYKHGIASKYSKKLKSFIVDDSNVNKILGLFFHGNYSYTETIKGFKQELYLMDKKLLIVYEDIDRISNIEVIKKIFYLSEKLCNDSIKILYQYDENKLKKIGFDSEYLEKYIPFKVNLSKITFFEVLKFVLKEKNMNENLLEVKDFDFLRNYKQQNRFNVINETFKINEPYLNINAQHYSVRIIKHFINEIKMVIGEEQFKNNKEIVIVFFYIKYFFPLIYENFKAAEKIIDTITFNIDSEKYTISKIIHMEKEKVSKMFEDEQNAINYCILKLLNYNVEQYKLSHNGRSSMLMESEKMLQSRTENDKKDRVIWNLIENGKSGYTNYEFVANKIIKDVLFKGINEQEEAFRNFNKELYSLDADVNDNGTIFLIGVPCFVELFKSFIIIDANLENKKALFELFMREEKISDINAQFINVLNYYPIKDKKSYIWILGKINSLNVVGNFNSSEIYMNLLHSYISALSDFGYMNTYEYHSLRGIAVIKDYEEFVIKDLQRIIKKLTEMEEKITVNLDIVEIKNELQTIGIFIEKMISVINCDNEIKDTQGIKIKVETTSQHINQQEYDRIKKILNGSDNQEILKKEIEKSYSNGKINIYEIIDLLEIQKKENSSICKL